MDVDSGGAMAPPVEAVDPIDVSGGGGGSNSGDDDRALSLFEDGEKSFGGNRWPRQETLALLKIRSDMDAVFRDATHKAPLWDEVSRKLGEVGFNRTPKKCKEKFENVYKYHKRTKEGRNGNSDNCKKNYRFSDELEAFNITHHHNHMSFQSHHQLPPALAPTPTVPLPPTTLPPSTVPSTMNTINNNISMPPKSASNPLSNLSNMAANVMFSSSTSSSTASEEDLFRSRRKRTKKRKWSDFFVKLTKEVMEKQEGLQLKFLEALERIENQRKLRDDSWRMKEMTRVNQEHEILVQEMATAAAKDAAVVAFLQKLAPLSPSPSPSPPPQKRENNGKMSTAMTIISHLATNNKGEMNSHLSGRPEKERTSSGAGISPSRWPKAEVEALIRLRTEMEMKYQENGPKGLLWEEISAGMRGIGYNRSSKRCKEKWENINKYFKKVKDSSKKRPEDSKTCPYFHQLDALYREKQKHNMSSFDINSQMEPLMVEPEQQWPPSPFQPNQIMTNLQTTNGEEDEDDEGSSSTDVED